MKTVSAPIVFLGLAVSGVSAADPLVRLDVDWPAFFARLDPVWDQLPRQWNEGAFVGNGQLGVMTYATLKDNRIDFHFTRWSELSIEQRTLGPSLRSKSIEKTHPITKGRHGSP